MFNDRCESNFVLLDCLTHVLLLLFHRGVATGGISGIYTVPKSVQVSFLCGNKNFRTVIEHCVLKFYTSRKLLYPPKTNFWLQPCCFTIIVKRNDDNWLICCSSYLFTVVSLLFEIAVPMCRRNVSSMTWQLPRSSLMML